MNIENILELESTEDILNAIETLNSIDFVPAELQAVYDGQHAILDRPNKIKKDAKGNPTDVTITAKLVLQYPKKIVESAVAFLFGVPVSVTKKTEEGDEAFTYLKDALDDLKWHSSNRKLSRILFTQRRAAKLFFIKNPKDLLKRKIATLILSEENGTFYPNFADNGDMDAFLRRYTKDVLVEGEIEKQEVYELYTAEKISMGDLIEDEWVETSTPNIFGKIPVIYYEQKKEEWWDGDTLIDRQELSVSELVDTNQYFGSPIAKMFGNVTGMSEKGDQGKLLKCEMKTDSDGKTQKSDVEYLTWDQTPGSMKMQFEMIHDFIHSFTQTADISFNAMLKNKPGNISGAALQFLMLDPVLKSMNKQELFDTNLLRELSVIMSILGTMEVSHASDYETMKFLLQFNSVLPSNLEEVIDTLAVATGNKPSMSQETAVKRNPLVVDKEAEILKLQDEAGQEAGRFDVEEE